MKAEESYIELYRQHADLVARHAPKVMNGPRQAAFDVFCKSGFPSTSNEEYRHLNLQEILSFDYGVNLNRLEAPLNPQDVFCCDVPNLSTRLFFVVNDHTLTTPSRGELPAGVLCGSLSKIATENPGLLENYYGRLSGNSSDGMVNINTLLAQDGFLFYVPANVVIEKPVQLIQVLHGSSDRMVSRRILVVMEKASSAQLLVCDHTLNSTKGLSNQVAEIFVGENASLDYYELEMSQDNTVRIANTFVHQDAGSHFLSNGITLQNGLTRNNLHVLLSGENAETNLSGMALADKDHLVDNHLFVDHRAPRCVSSELYKYVVDDQATGVFSGRVLVEKGAQKTSAYQSNKNLCSTREARMFTKPQLEIYADDVKCSHGSATGQIDEKALFYMRARGISESEARLLLKFAFTADVIDNIRLEPLRDRMKMLVEKRFRGELAKCAGCAASGR